MNFPQKVVQPPSLFLKNMMQCITIDGNSRLVFVGGNSGGAPQHRPKTEHSARRKTRLCRPLRVGIPYWYFMSSLFYDFSFSSPSSAASYEWSSILLCHLYFFQSAPFWPPCSRQLRIPRCGKASNRFQGNQSMPLQWMTVWSSCPIQNFLRRKI